MSEEQGSTVLCGAKGVPMCRHRAEKCVVRPSALLLGGSNEGNRILHRFGYVEVIFQYVEESQRAYENMASGRAARREGLVE